MFRNVLIILLMPCCQSVADELSDLRARIEVLESQKAAAVCDSFSGDGCGESSNSDKRYRPQINIGGFTKFDAIFDFNAIGSTDNFNTSTIATDGSRHRNTRLHARQTRLNFDYQSNTDIGEFRAFIEGDFFDAENALRMRHGYGTIGPLLAGQTWSTFMDESIIPALVDFESPTALLLTRRAMLRWTQPIEQFPGMTCSLAIEDPTPRFEPANGVFESTLPDFMGRLRYEGNRWHLQAAVFATGASYISAAGQESDATAWGINLTGRVPVLENDHFAYQLALGDGFARIRGGQSYTLDANGRLRVIPAVAWYVAYEHQWNDELKSVFAFSSGALDTPDAVVGTFRSTDYLAANVLWQPIDDVRFGVEYLWGLRENFGGASGDAHRLQFGIWYFLP